VDDRIFASHLYTKERMDRMITNAQLTGFFEKCFGGRGVLHFTRFDRDVQLHLLISLTEDVDGE
jgi:hypothetical protein